MNYSEPNTLLFEFVSEGGSWRIDDIQKAQKPRWSMSKILMDAGCLSPMPSTRQNRAESADRETWRCVRFANLISV